MEQADKDKLKELRERANAEEQFGETTLTRYKDLLALEAREYAGRTGVTADAGGGQPVLYQVQAVIRHCNQFAGYRKLVYSHAELYGAICNEDLAHSIFYADNNHDLHIVLNFDVRGNAMRFVGDLLDMKRRHTGLQEDFQVSRDAVIVHAAQQFKYVFSADYAQNDISPPETTVSVTVYHGEEDKRLQCIEDITKIDPNLLNKCHIASQSGNNELKRLAGNTFYGSRDFHAYFDGDSKELPAGQDPWAWGTPPMLWIELKDIVGNDTVTVGKRVFSRINIAIHFHTRAERIVSDYVIARLKEGSQVDRSGPELVIHTHYYSTGIHGIRNFYTQRNLWVQRRWRVDADMRTPIPSEEEEMEDEDE